MPLGPGSVLHARYELLAPLGRGGQSSVYLAHDRLKARDVALKVVAAESAAEREGLLVEFATLRGLVHPSLLRVYDVGYAGPADEPLTFYTAEVVRGAPIDRHAEGRPWRDVARALGDGLRALAALHGAGVRHGDFKPENLLVGQDGRAVLIDLGCSARPAEGTVSGTAGFIAPELLGGDGRADARSDLYAVGVTLGRLADLAPDTPPEARALAERLACPEPGGRPADVAEVLAALGLPADDGRPPASPARILGRDEELRVVREAFVALAEGRPGVRALVVHGPDGSGRTRLLDEAKWLAERRFLVVEGDARATMAVQALLGRAAEATGLPPDARTARHARARLLERGAPTVLVLDDVHELAESQAGLLGAFVRLLEPTDPILVLAAGREPIVERRPTVATLAIGPLDASSVERWVAGRIPAGRVAELREVTGGLPGEIRALLERVRTGAEDLLALAAAGLVASDGPSRLAGLDPEDLRGLGLAAAMDGRLAETAAAELGVTAASVARLTAAGLLLREGDAYRLPRLAEVGQVLVALEPSLARACHLAAAEWLATRPDESLASSIRHLALGGRVAEAEALLAASGPCVEEDPRAFCRAAGAVLAAEPSPEGRLAAAEVLELGGGPADALAALAPLLSPGATLHEALRPRVLARAGSCHLKLGDPAASRLRLEEALVLEDDRERRAAVADLECRARIQQGAYLEAERLAAEALEWTEAPGLAADLHEDLGVAASYLGRGEAALEHLEQAERLGARAGRPRSQVRALSYRAIHEYRLGHYERAAEAYGRALAIADGAGLVDQVASAALNLGTVAHRRGDYGGALGAYERGLAAAMAVGKVRTEATLRLDLAQLHADVGRFDRALQLLAEARRAAARGGVDFLASACDFLEGEVASWQGRRGEARALLAAARERLAAAGSAREAADVELLLAELELLDGRVDEAGRLVAAVRKAAEASGAEDLVTRALLLEGRLAAAAGSSREALAALEAARARAEASGERDLLAEADAHLAAAYEAQGAPHAARRHREAALELWDRLAATLPEPSRQAFHGHPRRAVLARPSAAGPAEEEPSGRAGRLERLLAIYGKLTSSLDATAVLEQTMDAAVELTRAERGFLILAAEPGRPASKLRVAVARNVDRERLGRPSMKFSRSIAERVLETGEPVLTAEAASDDRFAEGRSVQAMQLMSVLTVPIRGPEGVLGALYVDNRFQRGLFHGEDLATLQALADQAGIALRNARLVAALDERTRELEAERRRTARLLEERSREVDRLAEEVRLTRSALGERSELSGMVGRSPAMRAVFATVERVAGSGLTVLVHGESGTGKELVARALHERGPHPEAPFVSVSCAAVPETLLEAELFGHKRGAFTGADRDRTGLLVHARNGTILLDEVGEMPPGMQAKLLRVLQEREVTPLGSTRPVPVEARVVAATNRNLADEVAAGRFREDLYYRLAVVVVALPPLRERLEDVPPLAELLLARAGAARGGVRRTLSPAALQKLLRFDWPGNVRQLENVLAQAAVFAEGESIEPGDVVLPAPDASPRPRSHERWKQREAAELAAALESTRWNVAEVSRLLGIPRTSLYRKLREHGLARERGR